MAPPFWYDDPVYGRNSDCWRRTWRTCFIDGVEQPAFNNDVQMEEEMTRKKSGKSTQARQEPEPDQRAGVSYATPTRSYTGETAANINIFDVINRSLADRKAYHLDQASKIDQCLAIIGDSTKVKELRALLDQVHLS